MSLCAGGRAGLRIRRSSGRVFRGANEILRPGNNPHKYHKEEVEMMEEELVKKYYMSGTSHYLGLDVHDLHLPNEVFAEGMVFMIEPGIYIREEGIGVRLENNILIGKNGNMDLMGAISIQAEEIEEWMIK